MAGLGFKKMIMYEAPYVPTPAGGKTPSQHVAALWELGRADERGAVVTYFMCDVVGMPKIIGFLFRFFPMWPKLKAVAHTLPYDLTIMADTGPRGDPRLPAPLARGADHLAAEPAAAMAKEFFLGR